MTSSDDDLSWVLRRELNAEAARLSAAQDGLSQIRAQLRSRPAVPVWGPLWGGLRVDAERYSLRLRHLAAEAADWIVGLTRGIPFLNRRDHAAGRTGARPGFVWLRPVLAVAAVCIFAGTATAVPGLRHAITSIGSSRSGSTTSVTGKGGGSVQGGGRPGTSGSNGAPGAHPTASTTASPSPSAACASPAKPLPKAKGSPASSGGSAVTPTVAPDQSSPAATPTTAPAPTAAPTTPTGSTGPTPTDTAGAPLGGSSQPPSVSAYLTKGGKCVVGPTLKGSASASAASAGAAEIPSAIPTPGRTSAQVEQPAVTPATSSPATSSTATSAGTASSSDNDPATPSATSTASPGSPWSQGFQSAHACWHHPHPGCPSS